MSMLVLKPSLCVWVFQMPAWMFGERFLFTLYTATTEGQIRNMELVYGWDTRNIDTSTSIY